MTVRARLTRALAAASYSGFVPMLGQIAIVPVLVTHWGAVGYGEWVALTALATYLNYAGVGIPGALRAEMAMAFGQDNRPRMVESFQTSLLLTLAIAVVVGACFVGAVHVVPARAFVKGGFMGEAETRFVASVLGLQIVIIIVSSVLQAAIAAVGRYGLAMTLDANRQLVEFGVLLIAVGLFRVRPGLACLIYPAVAISYLALLVTLVWRFAPWLFALPWRPKARVLRQLSRPMAGVVAAALGYYGLSIQAPRIILLTVLGPAAVAVYAVTLMLMRITRVPISILAHAPTVELSFAHGEEDQARARRILLRSLRTSFWLSTGLIPVVVLLGPWAVRLWTGGRIEVPVSLMLLVSVSTALFSLSLPCQEALMSLGKLNKATFWLALGSLPFVALAIFLTRSFGLDGMGAAMVILDGAYAGLAVAWTLPLFGFEPKPFFRQLLTPPFDVLASEGGRLLATVRSGVFLRRSHGG